MPRYLPARPNLEHLRSQARTLLAELRKSNPAAVLAEAQTAIARENGFGAWASLGRHVAQLRSMEGTWAFQSLEVDGQAMPGALLTQSRILIDGDRFRMESPEGDYEGSFRIDAETSPQRIDIDFVEGPEAGNRSEGIFELRGDDLRICLGLVGSVRPKGFETARGSGHALEHLRRVERTRPVAVNGGTPVPEPPASPVAPAEDFACAMTPSLERLQGEWVPLELVTSGKPLQDSFLPYGSRVQDGVETKVVFGGQTMVHARMRMDEQAGSVDYLSLVAQGRGSVSLGRFRWEGDTAVFCLGAPGAGRPADFSCEPGSGRTLSRWKRKGL